MTNNHKMMLLGMAMVEIDKIKERLREAIQKSHLKQTEIAKRLSVSPSCIAHYVKGDIVPSLDTFANLCIILDEDPSYLLAVTDEN